MGGNHYNDLSVLPFVLARNYHAIAKFRDNLHLIIVISDLYWAARIRVGIGEMKAQWRPPILTTRHPKMRLCAGRGSDRVGKPQAHTFII